MTSIEPRPLTAEERAGIEFRERLVADGLHRSELTQPEIDRGNLLAALLHAEAQRDDLERRLVDCAAQLDKVIGERNKAYRQIDRGAEMLLELRQDVSVPVASGARRSKEYRAKCHEHLGARPA